MKKEEEEVHFQLKLNKKCEATEPFELAIV